MRARALLGASVAAMVFVLAPMGWEWARAQEGEKVKKIKRLMAISGSARIASEAVHLIIAQGQRTNPQVPERAWDILREEAERAKDELMNLMVPIYERYFTDDDIDGLIQFYESPVGRKLVSVSPRLVGESFAAAQGWSERLVGRLAVRFREEGGFD